MILFLFAGHVFVENLFLDICGNQCIMKAIGNLFSDGGKVSGGGLFGSAAGLRRGESGLLKAEPGFSCCRRIPMRRRAAFAFRDFYQWQKHTEIQKIQSADTGTIGFCHMCQEERQHARIEICYSRIAESEEYELISELSSEFERL